jgi:HD-GYP domain-containing protein (c-di-GMP phosphodiesterase class II)/DNA-binding CsgD family transcriptional regulator
VHATAPDLRLAQLLAGLTVATDLGMGQPPGHGARTCLLATELGRRMGLDEGTLSDVYYVGLLRFIGCTADAHEVAAFVGDEIRLAQIVGPHVMGDPADEAAAMGLPGADPALARVKAASMAAHCEAAEMLATRLGLSPAVCISLRHGFERFDGTGHPAGLADRAVPLPVRIGVVARDAELWARRGGVEAACAMVRRRRGRAYDPDVADAFLDDDGALLGQERRGDLWERLFALEPQPVHVSPSRLDGLLEVMADFADLKVPSALGHSRGVADLAAGAAQQLGLGDDAVRRLRRAGLVHDMGRCGISNVVWERAGPLSADDWERVRLHAYFSERILARTPLSDDLASLAGSHHERLDGSGYHRGTTASTLGVPARILAAADAYQAMSQDRPHRPRLCPAAAVDELSAEAAAGGLDTHAVGAVIAFSGVRTTRLPSSWPAGLTDREVDVLRLTCRGLTNREVAARLVISVKTVGRHLENSYAKIGVSSRASAALFAVTNGLLAEID